MISSSNIGRWFSKDYSLENHPKDAAYCKWIHYGMPPEMYNKHPEFCRFMEKSGLLSQMKVTKDKPMEIDGEPCILVKGEWMAWSKLHAEFEFVDSVRYHERFIVHRESRDVYTYLDNGKGLQPHHPYLTENNPTTVITEEEYEKVRAKALEFVRSGEENLSAEKRAELNAHRTFVIQVVTSYVKGPNTNAHELLQNPKHPYLRLIVGADMPKKGLHQGDVIEVGYGWKDKILIPFAVSQGRFRSPDVWEYIPSEEKVVTSMPVTADEAVAFNDYTLQYHRNEVNLGNPIGFHLARQNCSTYVRAALGVAGIKVPTEISLPEAMKRMAPDWFAVVGRTFSYIGKEALKQVKWTIQMLPKRVQGVLTKVAIKVNQLFETLFGAATALTLVPASIALGGALGEGGAAFVQPNETPCEIRPTLSDWKNWFRLSSYRGNLPAVLQEWQRKQASTVVYKKPVKLTVVP